MPGTTLKDILEHTRGDRLDYLAAIAAVRTHIRELTLEQFETELYQIEDSELIGKLQAAGVPQPYFDVLVEYCKERYQ